MVAVPYQLAQNEVKSLANPQVIYAVGGDNPTAFYINLPFMPAGFQWIFPYTYGFMYPIDTPSITAIKIDGSKTPPGFPPAPVSTATATLVAYDGPQVASYGNRLTTTSTWTPVGSKTLAAGADTLTTSIVPPTTRTLGIAIEAAGLVTPNVFVKGVQSGTVYMLGVGSIGGFTQVPVDAALDTTYIVTVSAGNSNKIDAYATDAVVPSISQSTIAPSLNIWTSVGSKTTTGVGADSFDTSAVPISSGWMLVTIPNGTLNGVAVTGNQTSIPYVSVTPAATSLRGPIGFYINPSRDQTYHISWLSAAGAGEVVTADVSGFAAPFPALGQQYMATSQPVVLPVDQSTLNVTLPKLASWPGRYDGQGFSGPAVAAKATVTLAANPTQRWIADSFTGSLAQISGAASNRNLNLIDGASGGASIIWGDQTPLTATATTGASAKQGLGKFFGTLNTAMTLEWDAAQAGVGQRVALGAYLGT